MVQEISPKIIDAFVSQFNRHVPWQVEVAVHMSPLKQGVCYICANEQSLCIGKDTLDRPVLFIEDKVADLTAKLEEKESKPARKTSKAKTTKTKTASTTRTRKSA